MNSFVDMKWKDCGGRSRYPKNLLDSLTQISSWEEAGFGHFRLALLGGRAAKIREVFGRLASPYFFTMVRDDPDARLADCATVLLRSCTTQRHP